MHSPVIYGRSETTEMFPKDSIKLTNVGTVGRLERVIHAPHFLLVSDKMLYSRHDTLFLNTVYVTVSIGSHIFIRTCQDHGPLRIE